MPRPLPLQLPLCLVVAALLGCAGAGTEAGAQDVQRCGPVQRFLTEDFGMVAETEPDTIDDWRTHKILPGCSVTAAGGMALGMAAQSALLYDQLRAAGWVRTPEPRDAPAEAALRLRLADTDCFFTPYTGIAIGTAAERRVNEAAVIGSDEGRFDLFVQCVAAMEAAP